MNLRAAVLKEKLCGKLPSVSFLIQCCIIFKCVWAGPVDQMLRAKLWVEEQSECLSRIVLEIWINGEAPTDPLGAVSQCQCY